MVYVARDRCGPCPDPFEYLPKTVFELLREEGEKGDATLYCVS